MFSKLLRNVSKNRFPNFLWIILLLIDILYIGQPDRVTYFICLKRELKQLKSLFIIMDALFLIILTLSHDIKFFIG